jgi:tetratricopeptide (TPR) repeat protein
MSILWLLFMRVEMNNLAESHCQRALSSAQRYDGEEEQKTTLLCKAFTVYGYLRTLQGNHADAVTFYEEAYNCVAMAYNPVHPAVQDAAGTLIECLIHKGDLDKAELFAQMTLDSLRDPANQVDQDGPSVAIGYYNLGSVIHAQQGDLDKAERLARESYRIEVHLNGKNHMDVAAASNVLANILRSKGNLGDETKKLYESSLAAHIKNEGLDGINIAIGYNNLSKFHLELANKEPTAAVKIEQLCLAKSCVKETIRIYSKIYGSAYPRIVEYLSLLTEIDV